MQTFMLQPARGPSDGDSAAPAPPPPTPGTAPPAEAPSGAAPPSPGLDSYFPIILMVAMVGLLFFTSRGEKKRREKIESALKKGDRVSTRSGIIGKITDIDDAIIKLEVSPGVVLTMQKAAVEGPVAVGEPSSKSTASSKKKKAAKSSS